MKDHCELATDLVKRAGVRGADQADVYITQRRSLCAEVRLGRVEKLEEADAEGLGMRVFRGGSTAMSYTSDLRAPSLVRLLDDTMGLVSLTDPDPCHRLPAASRLGAYSGPLELYDSSLPEIPTARKLELAREAEESGLGQDRRINNSNGAWWNDSIHRVTLANSAGFLGSYQFSTVSLGVSLVAEENGVKQADTWCHSSRLTDRLQSAQEIGRIAAERTIRKLGSRPIRTQTVPVVFEPLMGADFLEILFQAVSGLSIFQRTSFLVGRLGQQIGSTRMNVIDDATLPSGLASRPFDAEGVESTRTEVLRQGRLVSFLCDAFSSAKLHMEPTGNAARTFRSAPSVGSNNFYLEAGSTPPEEIIRSVKRGLLVTRLYWVGINRTNGDYSRGAEGIWIEDGELTHPVQEITIAGNVLDMMKNIEVIGNDLELHAPIASPTFLISNLVVSGR